MTNAILNDEFYPTLLADLRELLAVTPAKDRTIVLIKACLGDGIDTRARILAIAIELGIERKRLMPDLIHNTGDNPARHLWKRDSEARYSLHD